jgi:hypothetical protein
MYIFKFVQKPPKVLLQLPRYSPKVKIFSYISCVWSLEVWKLGIPESLISEILYPKSEFGAAICLHLGVTSCYR